MKVIFDSETDTLSIILRDEKIVKSDEVKDNVICCIQGASATPELKSFEGIL